jgi:hypothetical protein
MRYVNHVPKTGAAREFTEAVARLRTLVEEVGRARGEQQAVARVAA